MCWLMSEIGIDFPQPIGHSQNLDPLLEVFGVEEPVRARFTCLPPPLDGFRNRCIERDYLRAP